MIYFVRLASGAIKIGTTTRPKIRLGGLKSHYGCEVELLATIPGGRHEESEIHGRLAEHRIGTTEQFRPSVDVLGFIGRPDLAHPDPSSIVANGCRNTGMRPVRVDLSPDDHWALRRVAADVGLSMSSLAKKLIVDHVRANDPKGDRRN